MSKSINIYFGSVGETLNKYKEKIQQLKNEYIINQKIINNRTYLCTGLIKSNDDIQMNYEVVQNIFVALTNEDYLSKLSNIYVTIKDRYDDINCTEFAVDVLNTFMYEYSSELQEDGYDIETIKLLVYFFIKLESLRDSDLIYNVLQSEKSFIEEKNARNKVIKQELQRCGEDIGGIINIPEINEEDYTVNKIINGISVFCKKITNSLYDIIVQNKENEKIKNINLENINEEIKDLIEMINTEI